jgi:hypothetical protein
MLTVGKQNHIIILDGDRIGISNSWLELATKCQFLHYDYKEYTTTRTSGHSAVSPYLIEPKLYRNCRT